MFATGQLGRRTASGPPAAFDVVVMAASVGGVHALSRIVAELPASFPAAVVVAHHLGPDKPSYMSHILQGYTGLSVKQAEDGDLLRPATVFTSAPGRHLRVRADGTLAVFQAPRIRFVCPSADVLFESVASVYGGRAIAVVLTGSGRDGARGARAVRESGGFVIAQDETTAERFEMPCAAIETRQVDLVLPLHQIGFALTTLVTNFDGQ